MPKKSNRLTWAPKADQDLLDIWNYYAVEASAETADKIVQQIVAAVWRVGGLPLSGRSREDLKAGIRSVLAHPYVVFYRASASDVQIVRVLHERRDIKAEFSKPE
jgi:toxin ParE1/3/4